MRARSFTAAVAGEVPAPRPVAGREAVAPLVVSRDVQLYRSTVDLETVAASARIQCLAGAAASLLGFAGVIAGSPFHPLHIHGAMCMGALLMSYKNLFMTRKELVTTGMHHLQSLTLRANAASGSSAAPSSADALAAQLQATPEVELILQTASVHLELKLAPPAEAWEGAKYSGLITDERVAFTDLLRVLYIDQIDGEKEGATFKTEDAALLKALLATDKVVVEHTLSPHADLERDSILMPGDGDTSQFNKLFNKAQDASKKARTSDRIGMPRSAETDMLMVGRQTIISGLIFLLAGTIYVTRWFKGEGDNRLVNGKKVTTTGQDLIDNWKARFSGTQS